MLRRKITTSGNSAALVLSQDLLGLMGVDVGDEVDLEFVDRTLVVRPARDVRRASQVAEAAEHVLRRRSKLLRRLAEGDAAPPPKRRPRK